MASAWLLGQRLNTRDVISNICQDKDLVLSSSVGKIFLVEASKEFSNSSDAKIF